jgi:hypothetical protein
VGWRDWRGKTFVVPAARPRDGWRVAGDDLYTCVAPPGFEKDPAVTEAIRSFDPAIIPAWRIQLWHAPESDATLRVVHHGIMRHYPYPRWLRRRFHVELPQCWEAPEPNFLDVFFEDDHTTNYVGPSAYIPWDWQVYRYCRAQYVLLTTQTYMKRMEARRKRIAEERAKHQEELAYRRQHFEKTAAPILEKLTPQDWAEYEELRRTRGRSARRVSVAMGGAAVRFPGPPPGA